MEELLSVMMEIRDQLVELNSKMDVLTGGGSNSLSDITEATSVRSLSLSKAPPCSAAGSPASWLYGSRPWRCS